MIETLMPLEPLRERFTAAGLPAYLLELWFTRTLRDGMALAATGDYAPFGEVAAQALRIVSGHRAGEAAIGQVLAGLDVTGGQWGMRDGNAAWWMRVVNAAAPTL